MIKKLIMIVAIVLVVGFVGIQFVRPDFTNPPYDPAQTMAATTQMPENVKKILDRSCADCHSNDTKYPWYSKIQPSAWFMMDHIVEGRKELNMSVWATYEARRKKRKLSTICTQAQGGEMPLPSYLWIHGDAKMSEDDIKTLCDWTKAEQDKLAE